MNMFQWMLANPRTSIYKDPTLTYGASTMPEYPPEVPTNIVIKDFNINPTNGAVLITWADSSSETIKAASGDSILNLYIRKNGSNQFLITIDFQVAVTITKGPYK